MRRLCLVLALILGGALCVAEEAARLPAIYLIGDSTVRNGTGKGDGGLWGWGQLLGTHLHPGKVHLHNRAIGGRSSRTFHTEGRWEKVRAELRPGDFLLLQFGHNDNGPIATGKARASLKGNSDDTQHVTLEATGAPETVHSYGWYLRQYITGAKAAGATPIVLSPVPRNLWKSGKVARATGDFTAWAKEAALAGGAAFLDFNELVATRYEADGPGKVAAEYFTAADHTHTTKAGAEVNAAVLAAALRTLPGDPLAAVLKAQ